MFRSLACCGSRERRGAFVYSWYQKRGEMARSWCDKKPPATERRDKRYITFLTVKGDDWQEHMKRQEGEDIDALAVVLVEAKPHQTKTVAGVH